MAATDRSLAQILQDIIANVQEIVRSEVRLAKAELSEQALSSRSCIVWLAGGAVVALFALLFALLTAMYSLALVTPIWAAALIVAAVLSCIAAAVVTGGVRRFKALYPNVRESGRTKGEKVQWAKQVTK